MDAGKWRRSAVLMELANQKRSVVSIYFMIDLNDIARDEWPEPLLPLIRATKQEMDTSAAASELAMLRRDAKARRRQRVYTGRIGRRRGWRGMKLLLADGHIGELLMARRGAALVLWRDEFAIKPDRIGACKTGELRRFKLPSAVLLGSLKRGTIERPSARKTRAARINSHAPPRPGSRPKGRPRRH
jgi:hypothetical protein